MLKSKIEFDWQWVPYDIYQDLISITKDSINVNKNVETTGYDNISITSIN